MLTSNSALKTMFFVSLVLLGGVFVAVYGYLRPGRDRAPQVVEYGPPELMIRKASFKDLEDWAKDDLRPAFSAFAKSCEKILALDNSAPVNPQENHKLASRVTLAGSAADWRAACEQAVLLKEAMYGRDFQDFFEAHFTPVQILNSRLPKAEGAGPPKLEQEGRFTGYFEPIYRASRVKTGRYPSPLYGRPDDLIDVDLGLFRPDLAGERIAGRVEDKRLIPYFDHRDINKGALRNLARPLAWLDPNDLFFLQIQGSGRLEFASGKTMRVGYDGQNGHEYTAIGRVMAEQNIMPVEEITMQSIRNWLGAAHPDEATGMREQNRSFVFFRELDGIDPEDGPLGAQGVPLTDERSLAVDRRYHALGAPMWVEIDEMKASAPLRRLMIAQDTGGAIKGPLRGDIYWGSGAAAGERAGAMNSMGRMYVLLPRPVFERIPADSLR